MDAPERSADGARAVVAAPASIEVPVEPMEVSPTTAGGTTGQAEPARGAESVVGAAQDVAKVLDEGEEAGDEDDSEEESSEEEVVPLLAGREKRVNAGNRMQTLLDQEVEEDVMFAEEADDQDFQAKEEEDIFDSDFGSTSSGEDVDEEDEEAMERAAERAEAKKKNAMKAAQRAQRFLPRKMRMAQADKSTDDADRPLKKRRLSPSHDPSDPLAADASLAADLSLPSRRTTARATALSYIEAVDSRLATEHAARLAQPDSGRYKGRAPTPKKLSQAERIAEALETEEINKARLREFYLKEEERRELERRGGLIRRVITEPKVVWLSRKIDRNQPVHEIVLEPATTAAGQTGSTLAVAEHPLDALARQQKASQSAPIPTRPAQSAAPTSSPAAPIISPVPVGGSSFSAPIPIPSSSTSAHPASANPSAPASNQVPTANGNDVARPTAPALLQLPSQDAFMAAPKAVNGAPVLGMSPRPGASATLPLVANGQPTASSAPAPSELVNGLPQSNGTASAPIEVEVEVEQDPESRTFLILENVTRPTKAQELGAFFGTHTDWATAQALSDKLRTEGRRVAACAITGRPAHYRDPLTGVAYSDLAAYRTIKAVLAHRYDWCGEFQCFAGNPIAAAEEKAVAPTKGKGKGKKAVVVVQEEVRRPTIFERFAEEDAKQRRQALQESAMDLDEPVELEDDEDAAEVSMVSVKSAKGKGKAKGKARVSIASTPKGTPKKGKR